jgi:hypothetical protein
LNPIVIRALVPFVLFRKKAAVALVLSDTDQERNGNGIGSFLVA